jgi:hypothetical protein
MLHIILEDTSFLLPAEESEWLRKGLEFWRWQRFVLQWMQGALKEI